MAVRVLGVLAFVSYVAAHDSKCILARTETGWVCGTKRVAENREPYASFRGIPYAEQPLGELRFKELQPAKPWTHILNATTEGPACYQHNIFFGPLLAPQGHSESCIHVNVHVPLEALPSPNKLKTAGGLPIIVHYHGGGWISGSGDSDVLGPEYLVGKGVIVITFNYRLDFLGFLSLGTAKIPGNNGIRDCVTLLRWVKRNARYFGGDPDNITLAGQSAGSTNAHLLSLSPVSKGLFQRVWLMSGTAIPRNYAIAPAYAQQIATTFLTLLGLNGTDYDTVHDQLVQMPIEVLHNASSLLLPSGLTTFMPVQESPIPGVTPMIADDPEKLLANGYGDDIPVVVGYVNNEAQTFRPRLIQLDIVETYKQNPLASLPQQFLYTLPSNVTAEIAERFKERYFGEEPTLDEFVWLSSESFFVHPTLMFVRDRKERSGAPVYLYKFTYEPEYSVLKIALNLTYSGAAHLEDQTHIFKVNSVPVPASAIDDDMKDWVSSIFVNFAKTGSPSLDNSWPSESADQPLQYQILGTPYTYQYTELCDDDQDILDFYDELATLS